MPKLNRQYYLNKTELIAKDLLGKVLVHKIGKKRLAGIIVETEAYVGAHDLACHAARGMTERNKVMYEPGGIWYVYLIYGLYNNLNIVTEGKGSPSAVLIRALEPLEGVEEMKNYRQIENLQNLTSGPGKLCQALRITRALNMSSAIKRGSELFIEDQGTHVLSPSIIEAKRIGVDYAGEWKDRLLRFYIKGNPYISKP